jgi:hypothetical protein
MVVVVTLLLGILIGLIGTAGCNSEPIPAAGPPTTKTPTVSGESAADMRKTPAKEPGGEAALPRAVAADKERPRPDEGDQKRALLLFLLGVQQSRRAEAP